MSAEAEELSTREVTEQLQTLGVERDGVLLVHTSFRRVRPVQGGPLGLIEALRAALGPRGTLVMLSSAAADAVRCGDDASGVGPGRCGGYLLAPTGCGAE